MAHWEKKNLHISPDITQWQCALCNLLTYSKCINHWETVQKILHNWYCTPSRLVSIYPDVSPNCWRQCGLGGTPLHIWWECPKLKTFWLSVDDVISSVTGMQVTTSLAIAILGLGLDAWPRCMHNILTHILIVARLALARNWKSTFPPTTPQLVSILNEHLILEYRFAKAHLTMSRFYTLWSPWIRDSRSTAPG